MRENAFSCQSKTLSIQAVKKHWLGSVSPQPRHMGGGAVGEEQPAPLLGGIQLQVPSPPLPPLPPHPPLPGAAELMPGHASCVPGLWVCHGAYRDPKGWVPVPCVCPTGQQQRGTAG